MASSNLGSTQNQPASPPEPRQIQFRNYRCLLACHGVRGEVPCPGGPALPPPACGAPKQAFYLVLDPKKSLFDSARWPQSSPSPSPSSLPPLRCSTSSTVTGQDDPGRYVPSGRRTTVDGPRLTMREWALAWSFDCALISPAPPGHTHASSSSRLACRARGAPTTSCCSSEDKDVCRCGN